MDDILKMEHIVKIYPNGVVANKDVNFSVREGEIHALAGENGAGKSTLMKILFGIEQPTRGKIIHRGTSIEIKNPLDAIARGFGMVHQHFMLVNSMTVTQNIVLGSEPGNKWALNKSLMEKKAEEIIQKYSFNINPNEKIEDIPIGSRQKVEILKALYKGAKLLILDEPTAVLTPQETDELFEQLKILKDQGHTIIFISHKLNEIKEICDRVTIIRQGETVGTYDVDQVSQTDISNLMVGKNMNWNIEKNPVHVGKPILEVHDLVVLNEVNRPSLNHVSFKVHGGTIIGVVGVEGNGQRELVEAITGLHKADSGSIQLNGKDITDSGVKEIRKTGLSHIPEDRMVSGIASDSSIEDNMLATFLDDEKLTHGAFLKKNEIDSWSQKLVTDFQIKTSGIQVPIKMLSGGNIQKVIVAREFTSESNCFIANQPTRGIDIGTVKFIHRKLLEMRDAGSAVLLLSADLAEIMEISDAILVMYDGMFVAYLTDLTDVDEKTLGAYMLGIKKQSAQEINECTK